jgi:hypothetical protein
MLPRAATSPDHRTCTDGLPSGQEAQNALANPSRVRGHAATVCANIGCGYLGEVNALCGGQPWAEPLAARTRPAHQWCSRWLIAGHRRANRHQRPRQARTPVTDSVSSELVDACQAALDHQRLSGASIPWVDQ